MAQKITSIRLVDHSAEFLEEMHAAVQAGMKAIGVEAERYAKADCPVDTGRLRNSITFATEDYQSKSGGSPATSEDSKEKAKPESASVYIGTNVEYAVYVEYGDYNHKTGKNHFLRDSIVNHTARYKELLEAALKAGQK